MTRANQAATQLEKLIDLIDGTEPGRVPEIYRSMVRELKRDGAKELAPVDANMAKDMVKDLRKLYAGVLHDNNDDDDPAIKAEIEALLEDDRLERDLWFDELSDVFDKEDPDDDDSPLPYPDEVDLRISAEMLYGRQDPESGEQTIDSTAEYGPTDRRRTHDSIKTETIRKALKQARELHKLAKERVLIRDVKQLHQMGVSGNQIARRLKVRRETVSEILKGEPKVSNKLRRAVANVLKEEG
jgi:hypothetical protein